MPINQLKNAADRAIKLAHEPFVGDDLGKQVNCTINGLVEALSKKTASGPGAMDGTARGLARAALGVARMAGLGVSPAIQRYASKPGTYGAQRWLAAEEADELDAKVATAPDPKKALFYWYASLAFEQAVGLAKMSRSTEPINAEQFVSRQVRLSEYVNRIRAYPGLGELVGDLPDSPGATFGTCGGRSALEVAIRFAEGVNTAAICARQEISSAGATSYDGLAVSPKPHRRVVAWAKRTMGELRQRTLPPASDWPLWKMNRDAESLAAVLEEECAKGCKTAQPPLSEKGRLVYELLIDLPRHGAMTGPEILDAILEKHRINISQAVLTSKIIPELKPYGIENKRRIGYRIKAEVNDKTK